MNREMPNYIPFKLVERIKNAISEVFVFEPTENIGNYKFIQTQWAVENLVAVHPYGAIVTRTPSPFVSETAQYIQVDVEGTLYDCSMDVGEAGEVCMFQKSGYAPQEVKFSGITLNNGGTYFELNPAFNPDTNSYEVTIPSEYSSFTVKAENIGYSATETCVLRYNNEAIYDFEHTFNCVNGRNEIQANAYNSDASVINDYYVWVTWEEPVE